METDFEMSVRQFLARPPFRFRNVPQGDLERFCEALTHDSYTNEKGGKPYERLEFLGDAILEFLVCENVYSCTDLEEGAMTDFKQDKVANHRISGMVLAYGLDIDGMMRVGGMHMGSGKKPVIGESMRSDCFEALVASVYLYKGMDEARRVVSEVILGDGHRDVHGHGVLGGRRDRLRRDLPTCLHARCRQAGGGQPRHARAAVFCSACFTRCRPRHLLEGIQRGGRAHHAPVL